MGQSKQRLESYKMAKQALLGRCDPEARVVAETAIRLFDGFILPNHFTGGCYQVSMTLHRFLMETHRISTEVVVGYVNDGTDDIMISHAWLDYNGKKIDLNLHVMANPDATKPGDLIVLDQVLRPGALTYTYHTERTGAYLIAAHRLLSDPDLGAVARHKEEEHLIMQARSKNPALMEAYIAAAPTEIGYAAMTAALR